MCNRYALMFVGSVIGAGFASGREVISFFSKYGQWSWMFILISSGSMTALCYLCLRKAESRNAQHWCSLYDGRQSNGHLVKGCVLLLDAVMGGSMISAAGHITALVVPLSSAYLLGAAGTIGLAFLLGSSNARVMSFLSSLLAGVHVFSAFAVMVFDRGDTTAAILAETGFFELLTGAAGSVAYASLNLALAIGVICRCSVGSGRKSGRTAAAFGLWMTMLLFISNYLFLKHPELNNSTFPMVSLLSRFGIGGYTLSVVVMYLAILTTLSAVLYALRTGLQQYIPSGTAEIAAVCAPALLSAAGFEGLVERWYTPVGMLCLLLVFLPMMKNQRKLS